MDYRNPYQEPYRATGNQPEPGARLANAAMITGIIALVSTFSFTIYPPLILGSISIVLAILSRGRGKKFSSSSRLAVICAVAGLVINVALVGSSVYLLTHNSEIQSEFNQAFKEIYGESFDDYLRDAMNGKNPLQQSPSDALPDNGNTV